MSIADSERTEAAHDYELLLIAGRSGVGKSTVGYEISAQLQELEVAHCLIEGDNLDQAFPAPEGDPHRAGLTEANLRAMWANYSALGYRRLIYTNTVSVLEPELLVRAMGGRCRVTGVLLTADDTTAEQRLTGREIGSGLAAHIARGVRMARYLQAEAPRDVLRVATDGRTVVEIAREAIAASGWARPPVAA